MPRPVVSLSAVLLLLPTLALAQVTSIRGTFQDASTRETVPGVLVKLTAVTDTADVHRATAKDDGTFSITGLGVHSYRLEATRLGFAPLRQVVRVTKAGQDLGVLGLTPESVPVRGITVRESPAPATQVADTTEFRASAVKIGRDATAEDLVQKLPGVTMDNGQVQAQGETVQNVLVNGRPFFGSDPTAAMRNLPAEVVDRIQVYDKMSDQAEFSGFDDGQSQKTMNFILRNREASFGKVYAGGGDRDLYQTGGNYTAVRGPTRMTVIGMANNVNQQNFSHQDLFGALTGGGRGGGPRVMMRMGGRPHGGGGHRIMRLGGFGGGAFDPSSFLVGQDAGVSTTNAGGTNYVGQWGRTLEVSASLFANHTDTDNAQTLSRQYLPAQDSLAYYDQHALTSNRNGNQRFDARVTWTPDSLNSVVFQPRLYFQQSDGTSRGSAANLGLDGTTLGASNGLTSESVDGNNLSGRLTLRHRFGKPGRNVSAELNAGSNLRDGNSAQRTLTDYYDGASVESDTLDQQGDSKTLTRSYSSRIAFTEPLARGLLAQLIYNPSVTIGHADALANSLDPLTGAYTVPEPGLSNSYENRSTSQNGGVALLWRTGTWRLLTNASVQSTRLRSEQTWPVSNVIDHTYGDFLPSAQLSGSFSGRRNLRLSWRTSTVDPNIGQLQNVVNNSNPLALSTGNPDLRPSYRHMVMLRWFEADPRHRRSRFLFANVTRTSQPIANSIFVAPADTTVDGIFLARGTQLTTPENLDQPSWNANLFGVYSMPVGFLESIVSVNGGGSFARTPTRLATGINVGDTWGIRSGLVLASNISENVDFTVSWQGTWNISRSSLATGSRGDYYTHRIGARFNVVAGPGIVLRQELTQNLQTGVPAEYGGNQTLWNTTLGKKFLKDQRGELRVTATDVLAQDRSVSRDITEAYVQDQRDLTLGRYVQAVLTYNFR